MAVRPSSRSRLYCWPGRQLVVEHDRVGVEGEAQFVQLGGLALADEPGVIGVIPALDQSTHLVGSGSVDERSQLVEARLGVLVIGAGERDADEHDPLADGAFDEGCAEGFGVRVAHGTAISILAT